MYYHFTEFGALSMIQRETFVHFLLGSRVSSPVSTSRFRGAVGRTPPPPPPTLRNSIPCRPKGSPLCTILRHPFLVTDAKIFLKAPLAPIYILILRGDRAKKNSGLFFQVLPAAQKNWSKWGLYNDLGELRKSIWST